MPLLAYIAACKIGFKKIVNIEFQKITGMRIANQNCTRFWLLDKIKLLERMPGKLCLETMFSPISVLELVWLACKRGVVQGFVTFFHKEEFILWF